MIKLHPELQKRQKILTHHSRSRSIFETDLLVLLLTAKSELQFPRRVCQTNEAGLIRAK